MNKSGNYSFSADLIRVVAIVLVVIIHVFSEYVNHPVIFLSGNWWFANTIDSASRIAVPLFVMLSGMLILHSEKSYSTMTFLKKRFSKIGIPLLIWPVIYFLWSFWLNHKPFTAESILKDYVSLSIYYHLYYLYVIAGLYLLTPAFKVFMNFATKETKRYVLILTFLFSIIITGLKYFLHIGMNLGTIFTIFIPFVPYYLAGDYFRDIILSRKKVYLLIAVQALLILITAVGTMWHMQSVGWSRQTNTSNAVYDRYFYEYLSITVVGMSVTGYLLLQTFARKAMWLQRGISHRILKEVAAASFGIYLVHPMVLEFSNRVLRIDFTVLSIPTWLLLITKSLVILLVSYLLVMIIKKLPLLRKIF